MARKSLDARMDRLMDKLLPPGSMERREYFLPDDMREALEIHRRKTAAIISRVKTYGSGEPYRRLAEGELDLPDMPSALREALSIVEPPKITDDMTASEVAAAWSSYAFGDEP